MLPLKLTIEGLYSYQSAQIIDFEKLTSNQLFGIFGSVGSGKSSILEAMVFALYGDTDRLKLKGDSRNYNMMNLQSDRMLIDFECLTGKNEKYRFIYEAKRNSKRFEDVKPRERRILKEVNGEWEGVERASTGGDFGNELQEFPTDNYHSRKVSFGILLSRLLETEPRCCRSFSSWRNSICRIRRTRSSKPTMTKSNTFRANILCWRSSQRREGRSWRLN